MSLWPRYSEPEYYQWRKAVLKRDGKQCADCGWKPTKLTKGLAVHHVKSYTDYPHLRYDVSNGLTLCRRCHISRHSTHGPPEPIQCACGCGTWIMSRDPHGRPRKYVNHHHVRGVKKSPEHAAKIRAMHVGKKLTPEHKRKIAEGLKTGGKRIGRPPRGWQNPHMTEAEFRAAYPITPNPDLSKILHIGEPTVLWWAKQFGLKKAKKGRPPGRFRKERE